MENLEEKYSHIKGWGVDADSENEPTYPMKKYTGDDHDGLNYERPPLQPVDVEVLHSNERTGVSAVFGTPLPPSGLSGVIRRFAFKYSEGKWAHWLSLIMADRVNAMEGIVDDIKRGHVPNFFTERGWHAMWKHNPKLVVRKVATAVVVTAVIAGLLSNKNKKRKKHKAVSKPYSHSSER
jgi:hypothetical protein